MTDQGLIEAAQRIATRVAPMGPQIESTRRLPAEIVQAIEDSRIVHALAPRLDGAPQTTSLETMCRVLEALGRGDGSTGWCVMASSLSAFMTNYLPIEGQRRVLSEPGSFLASVIDCGGQAHEIEGGFRVTGRWMYASSSLHARWLMGMCTVYRSGQQVLSDKGVPLKRAVFLPASRVKVVETWNTMGLLGTGTNDFVATDVEVPLTDSFEENAPAHGKGSYAQYGLPLVMSPAMAAVPLGMAHAMLDDIRRLGRKLIPGSKTDTIWSDPNFQSQLALAEGELRGARTLLFSTAASLVSVAERDGVPEAQLQARLIPAQVTAMVKRSANILWELGGSVVLSKAGSTERAYRDLLTGTQHRGIRANQFAKVGRQDYEHSAR